MKTAVMKTVASVLRDRDFVHTQRAVQNKFKLSVAGRLHFASLKGPKPEQPKVTPSRRRHKLATRKNHLALTAISGAGFNRGARSAKVGCGFASDGAPNIKIAHDLDAKPLTLWRIMRGAGR